MLGYCPSPLGHAFNRVLNQEYFGQQGDYDIVIVIVYTKLFV